MALEDHLDELAVQIVEVRVHVVECSGTDPVEVEIGLGRLLEEHLGLIAHLLDDATQVRIEFVTVDAPSRLADVDAQIGGSLDVGDDLDRRHHRTEIAGNRRLQRDHLEAPLLEVEGTAVVLVVAEDHVVGALEVHREQDLRRTRDQFRDPCRHAGDPAADLVELLVECRAQVVHQPNRPVT